MLVKIFGSAVYGVDASTITIEVNTDKGIKYFLVGLPDSAIKESQYRIEAALKNSEYRWPGKKIIINLSPADIKKEGAAYDLPLALGILSASGQIDISQEVFEKFVIMGELSLDGTLQPIKGTLPIAIEAKKQGFKGIIVPEQNAREAAIVDDIEVYGAKDLKSVIDFLSGEKKTRANNR